MNTQPLVSIIIPTFNRAHLIGETLDSVLAQTYQNWECIVVDDGSTDHTDAVMAEYMERDSRFQYHHRPDSHKPGGNGARNYGFEMSRGEYIQWFDDDDIMSSSYIIQRINEFSEEIQFIICPGNYVNKNLEFIESVAHFETENLFKDYVLWRIKVFTPSILFRREFLEGHQLYNLSISRGQENEFFSRIFFNAKPRDYKILNIPLFSYRQHPNTKSAHNKEYSASFNWSKAYVSIENFQRGIMATDLELVNYFYLRTINLLFKSIYNEDKNTARFILLKFPSSIQKQSLLRAMELKIIGSYLINFKKGRDFFYQRWKKWRFTNLSVVL